MSNQIVISSGAKVRELEGVLTGTSGIVDALPINGSLGIPQLDINGKILVSQLPNSVMEYQGTWNATTNTPYLVNGVGNAGDVWLVSTGGVHNFGAGNITFVVSDQVIYSGTIWQKASGTSGTVTSVGLSTNGDSITISNSPVTTSATITANFNGTNLQYVNGAGNLTTFPTLITSIGLSMPSAFSVSNSPLIANGTISVSGSGSSLQYIDGTGALQTFPTIITEAQNLICDVYNETGATLTKGTIVYINGGHGNLPTVTKSQANNETNSSQTLGIVQTDITNMNNGHIIIIGTLGDLDTQAYAVGAILYLSPTVAGAWTDVKPSAPNHLVYVGTVIRSHPTQGVVEVRIQNGYELQELHNVSITSVANNDGLFYESATSLWKNKTIAAVLGYTPISLTSLSSSATGLTYTNTTGVFSLTAGYSIPTTASQTNWDTAYANRITSLTVTGSSGASTLISNVLNIPTYTLTGLGGVPTSRTLTINGVGYDLSADRSWTVTSMVYPSAGIALSTGTAWGTSITDNSANWNTAYTYRITGATTPLSIISNYIAISQASGSVDGFLSRFDWTTFNNKQDTITLTTTGTSGAATFTSNTLNIPQYQAVLTNPVTGTGTTNYLPKFTGTSAIGNSLVYDDGTYVGINTITPSSWATKLVIYNNQLTVTGGGYDGTFADSIFFGGNSEGTNYRNKISNSLSANAANQKMKFSVASGATTWVDALTLTGTGAATFSSSVQAASLSVLAGTNSAFSFAIDQQSTFAFGSTNGKRVAIIRDANVADNGLQFGYDTVDKTGIIAGAATSAGCGIDFYTFNGSVWGNRMRVTKDGNLVIGTSSDSTLGSKLRILGSINITGTDGYNGWAISQSGGNANAAFNLSYAAGGATNVITAQYNTGNVGINTDTDSGYKLDVNGTGRFSGILYANANIVIGSATNTNELNIYATTSPTIKFQNSGADRGKISSNSSALVYNSLTGNGHDFQIDGVSKFTLAATTGAATFSSSVTATSFFESSDSRLKTLIQDNYQIKGIASITPKLYTKNGKVELGYYAQDFVGILDSAVSKGSDDMLSLSYREVLVAKVYALEQEIKELKAKMH